MRNVKIYYCKPWGFNKEASRVEEELNKNFEEINIELIEGKLGQFTVYLDDKKIYNKMKLIGRFPKPMKITNLIEATMKQQS